jgi:uncharacterized CHY-type Zn-finger protein
MNSSRDKSSGNRALKTVAEYVIHGSPIDSETRCKHYHSPLDIVAIKFKCCQQYFPCFDCHCEAAGHVVETWPRKQWGQKAVLCGGCGYEMTIVEYMMCDNQCPSCHSPFNPGCRNHYHQYFTMT